jgi:hypothetical protein
MSSDLTIRFADDMPPASVEVLSPDYQTVTRLMLEGGREAIVRVPSEGSFLRVCLPSGRVVTLTDERGQLKRLVSLAALDAAQGITSTPQWRSSSPQRKRLRDVGQYHVQRSYFRESAPPDTDAGESVQLGPDMTARIFGSNNTPIRGKLNTQRDEATWELGSGSLVVAPSRLEIEHSGGRFYVLVPGHTRTVYARVDQVQEGEALLIGVRLATSQPPADSILNYLERGDLYSAEAMVQWVEEAHDMVASKEGDPYAAAVGAYLLLKLRRFDLLRSWAKNLADWFSFLPDGCVIWAWQQIYQNPSNEEEIRMYLLEAASRGLPGMTQGFPIYSQGLRLLLDGLNMMDDPDAKAASEKLRRSCGAVLWNSPVTAGSKLRRATSTTSNPVIYDVSFMAQA